MDKLIRWNAPQSEKYEISEDGFFIIAEDASKAIKDLNDKLSCKRPICPYCNTEMQEAEYEGYYEGFSYWDCDCEKLPVKTENRWRGNYN